MNNNKTDISQKVKQANREIYNHVSPEQYNDNESIFNEKRRQTCENTLKSIAEQAGNENYLDIGTGTGNLLRLSQKYFKSCFGADIGENLLIKVQKDFPDCHLFAADAEHLPIKNETFNGVSCYAMLHHLYKHNEVIEECFRILKPGGVLYTDHDPNYFFNRFYHLYYRIIFRNQHGFGSKTEDMAEYHNSQSSGINPEKLKEILLETGFRKVEVEYRLTDRSSWTGVKAGAVKILKLMSAIYPAKSFSTHFSIIAQK
jgi:ubiquinone/menaquinone biosynthesis C-methylase UbiE